MKPQLFDSKGRVKILPYGAFSLSFKLKIVGTFIFLLQATLNHFRNRSDTSNDILMLVFYVSSSR